MSMPQTVSVPRGDTQSTEEKELGLPSLNISVFSKQETLPGNLCVALCLGNKSSINAALFCQIGCSDQVGLEVKSEHTRNTCSA